MNARYWPWRGVKVGLTAGGISSSYGFITGFIWASFTGGSYEHEAPMNIKYRVDLSQEERDELEGPREAPGVAHISSMAAHNRYLCSKKKVF